MGKAKIDGNKIYQHVLALEGPRCPVTSYEAHEQVADYIIETLMSYGLNVDVQTLDVKGFDKPLRNIVASLGKEGRKAMLIGSHYDTVAGTPGANDNLSSVASMLEIARVLAQEDIERPLRFVFFTMEEYHPGFEARKRELMIKQDFIDEKGRFLEHRILKLNRKMNREKKKRDQTIPYYQYLDRAIDIWEGLNERDREFMQLQIDVYKEYTLASPIERASYPVGSYEYVKAYGENIDRAIIFDCLGWHKDGDHSQKTTPVNQMARQLVKLQDVDLDRNIGNYITMIGDVNSLGMLDELRKHIDHPNLTLNLPFNHAQIKKSFPDALRSDHSAFWMKNIPGIFMTDMANFRSDYYHTPGDTYEHIDYDVLVKLSEGVIKYLHSSK